MGPRHPTLRASRVEAEFEPDNAFPSSRVKSTPIRPLPPLSEPARRPFAVAFVTLTSVLALVAIIAGVVVVTLYLREPFDVTGTVARTLVRARTTGSVAGESNPATPPARQVAAIEPPSPVQSEQRVSVAPASVAPASVAPATAIVVAPLRSTGFAVRGVTDKEIKFGIAAPFSGSAKELGRQMKLGIDTAFSGINAGGGINGRKVRLIAADDGECRSTLCTEGEKHHQRERDGQVEDLAIALIPGGGLQCLSQAG